MQIQLTEEQKEQLVDKVWDNVIFQYIRSEPQQPLNYDDIILGTVEALNEILDDGTPIYTGVIRKEE